MKNIFENAFKKKKEKKGRNDMAFVQNVYFLKTYENVLCITFLYLCIILIWSDRKENVSTCA